MTAVAYVAGALCLAYVGMVALGAYLAHELRKRGEQYQL